MASNRSSLDEQAQPANDLIELPHATRLCYDRMEYAILHFLTQWTLLRIKGRDPLNAFVHVFFDFLFKLSCWQSIDWNVKDVLIAHYSKPHRKTIATIRPSSIQ